MCPGTRSLPRRNIRRRRASTRKSAPPRWPVLGPRTGGSPRAGSSRSSGARPCLRRRSRSPPTGSDRRRRSKGHWPHGPTRTATGSGARMPRSPVARRRWRTGCRTGSCTPLPPRASDRCAGSCPAMCRATARCRPRRARCPGRRRRRRPRGRCTASRRDRSRAARRCGSAAAGPRQGAHAAMRRRRRPRASCTPRCGCHRPCSCSPGTSCCRRARTRSRGGRARRRSRRLPSDPGPVGRRGCRPAPRAPDRPAR